MGFFKKLRRRASRAVRKATRPVGRQLRRTSRGVKRQVRKTARQAKRFSRPVLRRARKLAKTGAASLRNAARYTPGLRQAAALAQTGERVLRGQRLDRALKRSIRDSLPTNTRLLATTAHGLAKGRGLKRSLGRAVGHETRLLRQELQQAMTSKAPGKSLGGIPIGRHGLSAIHSVAQVAQGLRNPRTAHQAANMLRSAATHGKTARLAHAALRGLRSR